MDAHEAPSNMFNFAISIQQPWVDCILFHGKRLENRTRKPPAKLIGSYILLHASKTLSPDAENARHLAIHRLPISPERFGAIVGYARLKGYLYPDGTGRELVRIPLRSGGTVEELRLSLLPHSLWNFSERDERGLATKNKWRADGCYSYILDEVEALKTPIPCRGMLGFWPVPADVKQQAWDQFVPF